MFDEMTWIRAFVCNRHDRCVDSPFLFSLMCYRSFIKKNSYSGFMRNQEINHNKIHLPACPIPAFVSWPIGKTLLESVNRMASLGRTLCGNGNLCMIK